MSGRFVPDLQTAIAGRKRQVLSIRMIDQTGTWLGGIEAIRNDEGLSPHPADGPAIRSHDQRLPVRMNGRSPPRIEDAGQIQVARRGRQFGYGERCRVHGANLQIQALDGIGCRQALAQVGHFPQQGLRLPTTAGGGDLQALSGPSK